MEITDIHAHIFPFDYFANKPVDTLGLARTAALVRAARAEVANAILLDNGDFLQGNPMADFIARERKPAPGVLHPVIAAFGAIGVDCSTLGNHEFDYGLDFLLETIAPAPFPIVSANILAAKGATPGADRTLLEPYTILERVLADDRGDLHPVRIGIIGFAPPQTMLVGNAGLETTITTRGILETASARVPEMREAGADIVIALAHTGIAAAPNGALLGDDALALARVEGIDALLAGHQHLVFPSPRFEDIPGVDAGRGLLHGKPAVMAGFFGDTLGVLDLVLERGDTGWRIAGARTEARSIWHHARNGSVVPSVGSVEEVLAVAREAHEGTLDFVRRPVGRTAVALQSHFTLAGAGTSARLVNAAQMWFAERILRGTNHANLPLLSAAASYKTGGRGGPGNFANVPPGAVALRNVSDLYLYPNTLQIVKLTGAQLGDWLERAAGVFNRIIPGGRDQPLLNPAFPGYNFDVIDGVTYRIDLSAPSRFDPEGNEVDPRATRIVDLCYRGTPVMRTQEFLVVTNNYRASGGGRFPGADGSTVVLATEKMNRDIVACYIAEQGIIGDPGPHPWTFVPLPGTSVLFDTGPGAACCPSSVGGQPLIPLGLGPGGYMCYRLEFIPVAGERDASRPNGSAAPSPAAIAGALTPRPVRAG